MVKLQIDEVAVVDGEGLFGWGDAVQVDGEKAALLEVAAGASEEGGFGAGMERRGYPEVSLAPLE